MSKKKPFTTTAKTPAGILKAVGRYIRERGWCQGSAYRDGTVCLSAALGSVLPVGTGDALYNQAYDLLKKRIGLKAHERIWPWNDHPKRTLEEVLAVCDG